MAHDYTYDLAIIGAGPAGVTAALRAKELGAGRVVVIERGNLGGVCTNDGCVPIRVLAKAARLLRDARQWNDFGIGGDCPVVDMPTLMARVRGTVDVMHGKKSIAERLGAAGIELIQSEARFTDAHTLAIGDAGAMLTADKIIICAGGHAVRPPFPGSQWAHTNSDLWNLPVVPRRAIVVGAAATGCQVASVLQAFGASVTLIDAAPRLLPAEDVFVSEIVTAGFEKSGIRVLVGTKGVGEIEKLADDTRRVTVNLSDTESVTLDADFVLLSVGWKANLQPLCLDRAGVETANGYVSVDDTLRSVSVSHIFAAGDINGRLMLVQTATEQGTIAAENAVRGSSRTDERHIVPHGGFTDPEYASIGLTEEKARAQEPDCVALTAHLAETDRAVIDGRTVGGCKLIVSRQSHKILGAHVAGEEAMEIIHLCAGAMAGGITVNHLAHLELAYPTYSAVVGRAARDICRELRLMSCSPQGTSTDCKAEWEFGTARYSWS